MLELSEESQAWPFSGSLWAATTVEGVKMWRANPGKDSTIGYGLAQSTRAIVEGAMVPIIVGGENSAENPTQTEIGEKEHVATIGILAEADHLARLHAPMSPPAFHLSAAVWAARVMQFACHRLVDKVEIDTRLPPELIHGEPAGTKPAEHWSVDLMFRCWWDLMQRAFAANQQDTLNDTLAQVAARWPLAAVGTTVSCSTDRLAVVCGDPCLRMIYIDRVIARRDKTKATEPMIAKLIQQIGGFDVQH